MSHGDKLIKNSVLNLFNTLVFTTTSWVISIWTARQLGPANYGIFSLVLWVSGTALWLSGMGLTHAVTKFIAEFSEKNDKETLGAIITFVLKLEISITVAITVIMIFFNTEISNYFFSPSESFYFLLIFLGLIPGAITAILSSCIDGIQKFEYFTYANFIITPFSFSAKIYVLLNGYGITGLILVMLFFSFINNLYYFLVLRHEGIRVFGRKNRISKELKSRIHKYNLSVLLIILVDKVVWDKSENLFIARLCSASQVGFYNLGFNISQRFTSILPTTFWRVLFPAMSGYSGSGDKEKMKRLFFLSTRYLAFIAFPVGVGGTILAYQLINFMYGQEYIGAQHILQIMFMVSIVTSLGQPGAAVLYGFEKQSFIYKLGGIMAIVNIILDIILIKKYGAMGAAICYGITTVIGSSIGTIYTCKKMKLQFPVVSIAKILFSTIIMGIVMEIIIFRNGGVPGFVTAIIFGTIVYITSSLVLGTFEAEDYTLLKSVEKILPGKAQKIMTNVIKFLSEFKS